jgi:phage tail protein X
MLDMNRTTLSNNGRGMDHTAPRFGGVVEVVLVDAGDDLDAVSDVLRDLMALCLPDPDALAEAVPLTLLAEGSLKAAETLCRRLARAGALAEVRPARERYLGVRKPFIKTRKAA